MRLFLPVVLLPCAAAIWLPFANLDSMFATLKEVAMGENMQEPEREYGIFSYAKAGLDFMSQLKKYLAGSITGEDSRNLANGIRKIFNVTTTVSPPTPRFIPTLIPAEPPHVVFTMPYTTTYKPRTETWKTIPITTWRTSTTSTHAPSTTTPMTTTKTTAAPSTVGFPYGETITRETVPIPRHTTYSPVKIWPTTRVSTTSTVYSTESPRFTWVPVYPFVESTSVFPRTTTELVTAFETTTRDNIPAIIKERRLTKIAARTTTPMPNSGSNEICKPGTRCRLSLRSFETVDPALQYAYSHSTTIDDTLQNLLRDTQASMYPAPLSWRDSVTPEVVQLAQSIMTVYRPSRCLVVGVFTGLGLLGIAEYVDSRGIVVGLEHPEYSHFWENVGLKHAKKMAIGNISKIQVRSAEEIERALPRLATTDPNTFDFVFLDDFKRTNYMDDYENAVRLLRSGGLLMINRAFNGGGVLSGAEYMTPDDRVVRDLNLRIKQDGRVRGSLLPHGDGTWIIAKK